MLQPPLILVIDDTRGSREALVRMLTELGHRTACADSGVEGLRLARELQPSLVVLDVVMPGFDGYKVAAAIKAMPTFVPVILSTELRDADSRRRGQAAGADDFLSKPVDRFELQLRIAALLRIKQLTTALELANQQLSVLAHVDSLTGLANRRRFEERLAVEHSRAARYGRSLGVLVADIDRFKQVNDTWGHAAGDEVLRRVGEALLQTVRTTDVVARFGGEEFAVVAPELTRAGALTLADRLRRRVAALAVEAGGERARITLSVGATVWDGLRPLTAAELLAEADGALYAAKGGGRDRVALAPARPLSAVATL